MKRYPNRIVRLAAAVALLGTIATMPRASGAATSAALEGFAAAERGDFAVAVTRLETARAAEPKSPAVLQALAIAYGQVGRDVSAAMAFKALIEANPASAQDPVVQEGFTEAMERIAAKGAGLYSAAAGLASNDADRDERDRLLASVLRQMAAGGQVATARQFARQQHLDLSVALMQQAGIEADRIGEGFAYGLLKAAAQEIPQDARDAVAWMRYAPAIARRVNDPPSCLPNVCNDADRAYMSNPDSLNFVLALHWIWYAFAVHDFSYPDAHDAYMRARSSMPNGAWTGLLMEKIHSVDGIMPPLLDNAIATGSPGDIDFYTKDYHFSLSRMMFYGVSVGSSGIDLQAHQLVHRSWLTFLGKGTLPLPSEIDRRNMRYTATSGEPVDAPSLYELSLGENEISDPPTFMRALAGQPIAAEVDTLSRRAYFYMMAANALANS